MIWSQIRQEVFLALDLEPDTTGDTQQGVDAALAYVMDELAHDIRPLELLSVSSAVVVTSATTDIPLNVGGFAVTDMALPYKIGVDQAVPPADPDIRQWDELAWESYLQLNTQTGGDDRPIYRWVLRNDSKFILTSWPTGSSETWDVYLYYYRVPAAIADGNQPELPVIHHRTLVYGAATHFPQYFQGDREALFLKFENLYNKARGRLNESRRTAKTFRRMHPAGSSRSYSGINWGSGEPV